MYKMFIENVDLDNNKRLCSDPAADAIFQILSGARNFKLLMHALEIGLFDEFAVFGEPITAETAAKKFQFNTASFRRFLDALVAMGLLKKEVSMKGRDLYSNSSGTSKYLTRCRKPTLIAAALMESNFVMPMLDILPLALKSGSSGINVMGTKKGVNTDKMDKGVNMDKMDNVSNKSPQNTPPEMNEQKSADKLMKFLLCMDGMAQPCAPSLVRAFDLSAHRNVVDLGGGSGSIALELARTYPQTNVIIYDLPHVVQMAQKIQRDVPSHVTFQGGNFFEEDLPDADLYIFAHVLHDWEEEKVDILLEKVHNKLPPGGSLLVLEKVLNEKRDGPLLTVTSDLIMSLISKGKERTESEYRKLFSKHGFSNTCVKTIEGVNYYDAILTKKPFC